MDIEDIEHNELLAAANRFRGDMLDGIVWLERLIDTYLALHFTGSDKLRVEILYLVFATDRINLGSKIQVLDFLFKKYESDFLLKYPSFLKDVVTMTEHRNICAHYLMDADEEAIAKRKDEIRFIKFKNERTYKTYSIKETYQLCEKLEDLRAALLEVISNRFPKSGPNPNT